MRLMLVSALLATAVAGSANAATIMIDFNDLSAPGFTGNFSIFSANAPGIAATVNGTPFLAVPSSGASSSGNADFTSANAITSFAFDVNTPDSYNTLTFFNGATQVGTAVSGSSFVLGTNTFTFLASQNVTRVNFASSQRAFEIDNLSVTAVPEPATWALMIVGFGMVGVAARRRSAVRAA